MHRATLFAAVALTTACLAAGVSARPSASPPVHLFDYSRQQPLRFRVEARRVEEGVPVQEVSFEVPGLRLDALLVLPPTKGRHPAVLIAPEGVHDRHAFEREGRALARRGLVVLLLDGPWVAAQLLTWPTCTNQDRAEVVRSVVELRRGLDVLSRRPEVDPSRLAVAGYSYSAWTAGILAGVDRRPRAFVLESGEATMTRFLREECGTRDAYVQRMRPLDPVLYVGGAPVAAFLFQNATSDQYWPRAEMVALQRAARGRKTIRWYDTAHSLDEQAERDRIAWLVKTLRATS